MKKMNPTCNPSGSTLFTDPEMQFFLSGRAHAWYGALGLLGVSLAIALGAPRGWALAGIALSAGVFVDMWAHDYEH